MANAGLANASFAPGIGFLCEIFKLGTFCLLMEISGYLLMNIHYYLLNFVVIDLY